MQSRPEGPLPLSLLLGPHLRSADGELRLAAAPLDRERPDVAAVFFGPETGHLVERWTEPEPGIRSLVIRRTPDEILEALLGADQYVFVCLIGPGIRLRRTQVPFADLTLAVRVARRRSVAVEALGDHPPGPAHTHLVPIAPQLPGPPARSADLSSSLRGRRSPPWPR